ncbi:mBOAT family protein [Mycoplasma sp. CAG:611]|nr:mBOAT family protein [Mycoplasma sp. CAG:611]
MLFTSISFLYYFLPTIIILYFITPKKYRNYILLIFSIIFYMYGEPKYVILMLVEILVAYFGALLIDKYKSKEIFLITIIIHIGLLCVFKYTDLFIGTINSIFKTNISFLNIALPIGISFYTFQILSYVIDVYRGKVKVQKNILKLATYVSLFPQLIAGPIVRYETICDELDNRDETIEKFSLGVRRFIIGLAKKVLIANMLGELCTKFSLVDERSVLFYWIFAISYMLQVYFDFSAYSDMAIGLGKMFGFTFLENFNYPFISKSITEFWRRWHISLSSWFKDYVYIPLGGSRKGTLKLVRNVLIVWFLTGIWHGAAYNFILWGLFIGVFLVIEKLWLSKYISKLPKFLRNIYVLFIIMISFIMFNAGSINEAFFNIKGLFGLNKEVFINNYTIYYLKSYLIVLIIAIFGATPLFKNIIEKLKKSKCLNKIISILEPIFLVILLLLVTAYLIDSSYNPFLYFRF